VSSYLGVLRHRDFRYLFAGQAASVLGDRVVIVALALFVTETTRSATDLGIVLAAQSLPLVALLLLGGVWADRLPRQRIIVATDVVRAALHGLLALLIVLGRVPVWQIALIEACFGAAQAFFQPAYSGLVPQTVPEAEIQDARALTETVGNLAFLVGPALGTALVLGLGAWEAFALDAASFVCSAVLLLRVNPRPRGVAVRARSGVRQDLRAGWREVRSRQWVWVTIAVFTGSVVCVYAQGYSLAPGIARDVYGSAGVFGVLESCIGVGSLRGALIALRWRPARPLRAGMLLVLAWPLNDLAFALASPLVVVGVLAFCTGFGFSLLMIWWETTLARHTPPAALSRVSAWDWMGPLALLPLGYAVAASLVLNVAFVTGFAGRALDALRVVPDFRYSATQSITLEHRPVVMTSQVAPFGLMRRAGRHEANLRAMRPRQQPARAAARATRIAPI